VSQEAWTESVAIPEMLQLLRQEQPELDSDDYDDFWAQTNRKLRLFAVACCDRISELIVFAPSQEAVRVAEAFADEEISREEFDWATAPACQALWGYLDVGPEALDGMDQCAAEAVANCVDGEAHLFQAAELAASSAGYARVRADGHRATEEAAQVALLRDIFGNPFRPVVFDPTWRTNTAVCLAQQMYESRDFSAMPILADALQDAGCDNEDILNHCRDPKQVHVRGCWVVDLVLGK
jgi:hypothetical protein